MCVSAKVNDTISYWHVQYNMSVILELHQGMEAYVLKMSAYSISEEDILGIRYSPGCFICSDCTTHLGIYTQDNKLLQHEDATGHWTPIVINFRRILLEYYEKGKSTFDFYFLVGNKFNPDLAIHILRLQLE